MRFGLRTLMLVVTLIGLALGIGRAWLEPYRRQRAAVESLVKLEPFVETRPVGPGWLRRLVGEELLRDIVSVNLEGTKFTADELAGLADLPKLERLYLADTPLDDHGLEHVRGLRNLQRISLWRTRITDDGLRHLSELTNLESLDFHATATTQDGLRHLQQLDRLLLVHFSFPLDDEGIELTEAWPQWRPVVVSCNRVTSRGLEKLSPRSQSIATVSIALAEIDSSCLTCLSQMPALECLNIRASRLPDDLTPLERFPRLRVLRVSYCAGTAGLFEVAPRLRAHGSISLQGDLSQARLLGTILGDRITYLVAHVDRIVCLVHTKPRTRVPDAERPWPIAMPSRMVELVGKVRPADLACLSDMPELEQVEFVLPVGDETLARLADKRHLRSLTLVNQRGLDELGRRSLAQIRSLRQLHANACNWTDADVEVVASMPELEDLMVTYGPLRGDGLNALRSCPRLEQLNLLGCRQLTDAAVEPLLELKSLKKLWLNGTGLSAAGVARFQGLPQLWISADNRPARPQP